MLELFRTYIYATITCCLKIAYTLLFRTNLSVFEQMERMHSVVSLTTRGCVHHAFCRRNRTVSGRLLQMIQGTAHFLFRDVHTRGDVYGRVLHWCRLLHHQNVDAWTLWKGPALLVL